MKTNSVIWTSFVAMYCVFVLYSFVACCDFVFFLCEVCVMFFSKSTKFDNGIKGNVVTNKSAENLHLISKSNQNQIKSNYFIVCLKVDQKAGQLSLPHLGITKTEKIELKHKTDEQRNTVNGLEPRDQSDRQKQTKVEDNIFCKGRF